MPAIKGTSSVEDARARNKALRATKFPKSFNKKVRLAAINKDILTQWIEEKVASVLGFEDEIVSSTAVNLFLESSDPRRAQLDLVGFLGESEAAAFSKELWTMMLEAQDNGTGVPTVILDRKKKELQEAAAAKEKEEEEKRKQTLGKMSHRFQPAPTRGGGGGPNRPDPSRDDRRRNDRRDSNNDSDRRPHNDNHRRKFDSGGRRHHSSDRIGDLRDRLDKLRGERTDRYSRSLERAIDDVSAELERAERGRRRHNDRDFRDSRRRGGDYKRHDYRPRRGQDRNSGDRRRDSRARSVSPASSAGSGSRKRQKKDDA
mmetsp:Transcript_4838/g.13971  ORF Transcript_4838/g.13971 Transcript_4838/m.13971 type:complete len:316 (+) Transcript_4838:123-1070(+)